MTNPAIKLPDALRARRRKIEAAAAASGDPLPGEPDPAPAPAPEAAPVPEAAPAPAPAPDPVAVDEGEDEGLDGLDASTADFLADYAAAFDKPAAPAAPAAPDPYDRDRAAMEQERQRLQEWQDKLTADQAALDQAKKPAVPQLTNGTIPEEEQTRYAGSKRYITETALAAVGTQMNPILQDIAERLAKLETGFTDTVRTVEKTAQETKRMSDAAFNQALAAGLGNTQDLFKDPRFVQFLKRKVPYSNTSFRDLVSQAVDTRNPEPILRIARAFVKSEEAAGRAVNAMRAAPALGAQPQNGLRDVRPSGKLPWSERAKAWDAYRSGTISSEQFQKVKAQYEQAEQRGMIDYDH